MILKKMKKSVRSKFLLWFSVLFIFSINSNVYSQNVFSIKGNKTYLNDREFQAIGLRCSNALFSDETVNSLIDHLDEYKSYGVNSISVYFLGSRYSNIYGYDHDGSLNEVYKKRMAKIIGACDQRDMVVLVGILYWGSGMHATENNYYAKWEQKEVNNAICNTVQWLTENQYRNVFVDPDNEGMAERGAGFNIDEMICEAKEVNPNIMVAYNGKGYPPPKADLSIHFGFKTSQKPYIQTEGNPQQYWGDYSKEAGMEEYINVGIYTPQKKEQQLKETKELLEKGYGYFLASTWLQNVPPNYELGGDGTHVDPGIKWWLEYIKENFTSKN